MHATVVIRGLTLAIETALAAVEKLAFDVDVNDRASMLKVLSSCIGTKFTSRFGPLMAELALDAVLTVARVPEGAPEGTPPEVDTKRYAKVEKLPGGDISDCRVLKGVMFNKDVVAPGRMRRTIRKVSFFFVFVCLILLFALSRETGKERERDNNKKEKKKQNSHS